MMDNALKELERQTVMADRRSQATLDEITRKNAAKNALRVDWESVMHQVLAEEKRIAAEEAQQPARTMQAAAAVVGNRQSSAAAPLQ